MTVVVSDSFNRADNASSLGSADTGQAWTALAGTWGISSNQAYCATSGGNQYAAIESGVSDCDVQVTFTVASANCSLLFRVVDAQNFLALMRSSTIDLRKMVGGTVTTIASLGTRSLAAGDVLKVTLSGSSVSVFLNGTQIGTTQTITDLQTATQHGLGWFAPSPSTRWDDFSVSTAAAGTINATGTATLALGCSGVAAAMVQGAATAALALVASGQAAVATHAGGAASLSLAASAQGAVAVHASGSASLSLAASGTIGTPPVAAIGTATLTLGAAAAATVRVAATATATLALGASASAATLATAQGQASLALGLSATAGMLVTAQGAASLALSVTAIAHRILPAGAVPALALGPITDPLAMGLGAITDPLSLTLGAIT